MITFTKDQLIASAHARIEFAEMMLAGELEPLKERTWSIELELARIALASLEAELVSINDDMAYAFHHALSDSPLGADEVEEINAGLRAAFANVTAPPAPVSVPDESAVELLATDLMKRIDKITGERHSVATLSSLRVSIVEACRAAMLQGAAGNSPVIPDEVLSAVRKVARIRSDFNDFDGDRRGIGDCLDEAEQELIVTINRHASAIAAAPQQEVKK